MEITKLMAQQVLAPKKVAKFHITQKLIMKSSNTKENYWYYIFIFYPCIAPKWNSKKPKEIQIIGPFTNTVHTYQAKQIFVEKEELHIRQGSQFFGVHMLEIFVKEKREKHSSPVI